MREQITDLFGEIPVTVPEVRAWLEAVPQIDPDGPRAAEYVRLWNVPDKIRAAKAAGWWHELQHPPSKTPRPVRLGRLMALVLGRV